jgi:hypothetical protein
MRFPVIMTTIAPGRVLLTGGRVRLVIGVTLLLLCHGSGIARPKVRTIRPLPKCLRVVESSALPLTDIDAITFSPSGDLLAMCDKKAGAIHVCNLATGQISNVLTAPWTLTDSIDPACVSWTKGYRYATQKEVYDSKGNLRPDVDSSSLQSNFTCAVFLSDSVLLITTEVKRPIVKGSAGGEASVLIGKAYGVCHVGVSGGIHRFVHLQDTNRVNCPTPNTLALGNMVGEMLVSVANWDAAGSGKVEDLVSIGSFDSDGRSVGISFHLPGELSQSRFYYDFYEPHLERASSGEVLLTYGELPFVFLPSKGTSVPLWSLPYTNNHFLNEVAKFHRSSMWESIPWDSLLSFRQGRLLACQFTTSGTILATYTCASRAKGQGGARFVEFGACEYSGRGELLSRTYRLSAPNLHRLIKHIAYDPRRNQVLYFERSSQGWSISTAKL